MRKFLHITMAAMVGVGIHCSEQMTIVTVDTQSSLENLKSILSQGKIKNFKGRFVAYKTEQNLCENPYAIKNSDNCHYGYLGKNLCRIIGKHEGYILSCLSTNERPPIGLYYTGVHQLTEAFINQDSFAMRNVTLEEMVEIIRGLKKNEARLYYNYTGDEYDAEKLVDYVHLPILDIANAVYAGRPSKGLFEWPEFRELLYCLNQQYPDLPNDLLLSNKCILGYLGLLKLRSCVYY